VSARGSWRGDGAGDLCRVVLLFQKHCHSQIMCFLPPRNPPNGKLSEGVNDARQAHKMSKNELGVHHLHPRSAGVPRSELSTPAPPCTAPCRPGGLSRLVLCSLLSLPPPTLHLTTTFFSLLNLGYHYPEPTSHQWDIQYIPRIVHPQ